MADEPVLQWGPFGDQFFKVDDGDDSNGPKQRKMVRLVLSQAPGGPVGPLGDGRSQVGIEQFHVFHALAAPTVTSRRPASAFTSFFAAFAPLVPSGPRPVNFKIAFQLALLELSPGGFAEVTFTVYRQPAATAADLVPPPWRAKYTFSGIAASGLSIESPPGAAPTPAPSTAPGQVNGLPMTRETLEWKNLPPDDYALLATLYVEQPRDESELEIENPLGFDIPLSGKKTEAILAYDFKLE